MTRAMHRPLRAVATLGALRALVLLPLLLTGAACATVPDLGPKPEPATATAFAAARSLAGSLDEWPRDNWWEAFGDPQLDALVREALANSPNVEQAAARLRVARAHADLARAARLPHAAATVTARESRLTQSIGLPTDGEWHLLTAGLTTLSYDLDMWGGKRAALRAAVSVERAAAADTALARLTLSTAVAASYVELAQWQVRRDVAADAQRIRRDTRDLVTRRYDAGLEPQAAVEQAEASVEAAGADVAALDESMALTRNALAALLGAGPDRGLEVAAPSLRSRRPAGLPAHVPVELVGRRPEVVTARWRVEAAAARIGVARAGFYPSVNLNGLIGLASFGLNNLVDSRSVIGSAGPALSLPIFDGGRRRATYHRARGEYDAAVAAYDAALLHALREAADAATSLQALSPRTSRTEAAVARMEAAYRLSRIRYDSGLSDYHAVLISENALLSAREQAATLRLRGFLLDIALAKALGGGFRAPTGGDTQTTLRRTDR
jgi:NodT family efflux transporter outer membrane factor (OMF) lipoprotein